MFADIHDDDFIFACIHFAFQSLCVLFTFLLVVEQLSEISLSVAATYMFPLSVAPT